MNNNNEQEEKEFEKELDAPPVELGTFDAKISAVADGVATGSIAADLVVLTNRYLEDTGFPVAGRRKLRATYNPFRTSGRRGDLYFTGRPPRCSSTQ